jgi:hypothetical protein
MDKLTPTDEVLAFQGLIEAGAATAKLVCA